MSILNKIKGVRASRWLAIVAVSAMIPLTAGCTGPDAAATIWLYGYAYEFIFAPARAMFGTALLDFINTH